MDNSIFSIFTVDYAEGFAKDIRFDIKFLNLLVN